MERFFEKFQKFSDKIIPLNEDTNDFISNSSKADSYLLFLIYFQFFNLKFQNFSLDFAKKHLFNYFSQDLSINSIDTDIFNKISSFLNQFSWNINEFMIKDHNKTITPSILEFIFERSNNQKKKRGVYYTPKKITVHIVKDVISSYFTSKVFEFNGIEIPEILIHFRQNNNLSQSIPIAQFFVFTLFPELKIIDISCGSGSFLLTTLEILMDFYLQMLFVIHQTPQIQSIIKSIMPKPESSTMNRSYSTFDEFSNDNRWRFYVKRTIIVNNLFGVDLIPETIQIVKFRLILALTAEFDYQFLGEKILPFDEIQQNFRYGNSLLGFVKKPDQIHLQPEIKSDKIVQDVDAIYFDQIIHSDFIRKNRFGLENKDFHSFQPFHWFLEFPTLKDGLDIIIGNPPYGIIPKSEKILGYEFQELSGTKNIAELFLYRQFRLLMSGGYFTLVLPKPFLHKESYASLRQYLISNYKILTIVDLKKTFKGVGSEQVVISGRKLTEFNPQVLNTKFNTYDQFLKLHAPGGIYFTGRFLLYSSVILEKFLEKIKVKLQIGQLVNLRTFCQEKTPGSRGKSRSKEGTTLILGRKDFIRFMIGNPSRIGTGHPAERASKIIIHRSISSKPHLVAAWDKKGWYIDEGIYALFLTPEKEKYAQYLVGILNSRFIAYYCHVILYNKSVLTMDIDQIEKHLVIPIPKTNFVQKISTIVQKLEITSEHHSNDYIIPELDLLVYQAYDLTKEEIKEIKKETAYLEK